VLSLCHQAGFSPNISLEAQMQTIVNLVAAGLGVALVPQSLVNLRRKGLTYKRLADPVPKIALAVAWRADDPSPVLHTFLQVVTRVAGRLRRKRE
jgi:DNA-binding transcriptional LysR family regulator